MNKISKLRSKNYGKVIEVKVPVRFYWDTEGYDGFEFGSLEGCSRYQLGLLNKIVKQPFYEHDLARMAEWLNQVYPTEWNQLVNKAEAEDIGIPKAIYKAFKGDDSDER